MKNKFITILILMSLMSCSKERLTRPTQKGANTFSCKVDGVVFKPSKSAGLFGTDPLTVENYKITGFTLFANYNETENGQIPKSLVIYLQYIRTTGSYDLNDAVGMAYFKYSYAYGPTYRTNSSYTGQVNITRCDTANRIYSGTFYFKAIDENTGKVVNVTDGRFDVKGK